MNAAIYLRVSTDRQSEQNQRPDCVRICEARKWTPVFFEEVESGAKARPVWLRVVEQARLGKVGAVVTWALDRMGRNRVQVAHDLAQLFRFGVDVVSVQDAWLDQTKGPMRDLLVQVMAWVAEGERARLIERTKAGLERARALGHKLGRPGMPEATRAEIAVLHARGFGAYRIAKELGLKESTVRTHLKRAEVGLCLCGGGDDVRGKG